MLEKMQLREGADVFATDGKQVGKINRLVLNPATNEVTHIVVQKGWLLPADRVVPMHLVHSASEDQVILSNDIGDLDKLPPFEERHFIKATEDEAELGGNPPRRLLPAYYWYPPEGYSGYPAYGLAYYPWPPVETQRNIPDETVPLKEGSQVISSDGKHVGEVERLFVETDSSRVTHFVISHGTLRKELKRIPADWVKLVAEDKVYIVIPSELVKRLPVFEL